MIEVADAPFFFGLNSDPLVLEFTGDEPFADLAEAEAFIGAYDQYRRFARGRMAIEWKETGELLGWCGLKYHEDTGETDIGYRMLRKFWNQGFATEAAQAAIEDGRTRLGLDRVVAHIHPGNAASFRVAAKLGMGFCREYIWEGQTWHQWEKFLLRQT